MRGLSRSQVQAMINANERKRDILRYPTKLSFTADTFDSSSNLDKINNGNIDDYAEGSKTGVSSSGQAGSFKCDLGFTPTKTYKLSVLAGVIATAGNPGIYLYQSDDGSYGTGHVQVTVLGSVTAPTSEKKPALPLTNIWNRYFKIAYVAGSSTADITGRLYNAQLLDIPMVS